MTEPRDRELSGIYREAGAPEPPQRVDDAILAASRRAAGSGPRLMGSGFARRWGTPFALAATVVVTFTLTLMVFERDSDLETMTPAAPRGDQPPPSAEQKPAAPAAPVPQAAARRDRAEQRPSESAASSDRLGTGQPVFVPDAPRPPEALLKREKTMPAPAAPASDAQRASELRLQAQPAEAPATAAASAADASSLRESASTVRSAGVIASRLAVSEAKERTPERWLEDIRKLKSQGKTAEAERELAEFKKRHPDYRLPEDLR